MRDIKIKVTNRGLAEVIKFDIPYIIISIYSTESTPASIPKHPACLDILPIQFDDLNEDEFLCGDVLYKAITEEQAKKIWTFVDYYINREHELGVDNRKAELILVHCDAGTCRSPAIAAAISRVLYDEDKDWFSKPYLPNMKVYHTMLKVKGLNNEY